VEPACCVCAGRCSPNVFEGVTDYFTELTRMRGLGIRGAPEAERTHASAWVPITDTFARGDDLVIRVELASSAG
jgi:HSP20 family protein